MPLRQKLKEMAGEAMLDAAERCMIANGYENTTMQQIAAEAGCATGTFYIYFKSKQEILKAIVARHAEVVYSRVEKAFWSKDNPLDRLRAGITEFHVYANEHQGFFRLFMAGLPMRHIHMQKHVPESSWNAHQRQIQAEVEAIREAQEVGLIRKDLAAEYIQDMKMAMCMNNLERLILCERPIPIEEQVNLVWAIFYEGISAR